MGKSGELLGMRILHAELQLRAAVTGLYLTGGQRGLTPKRGRVR